MMPRKTVSFGESSIHEVELVAPQFRKRVWYNGAELQMLNYNEVEQTKKAEIGLSKAAFERAELSWRGLESIQKGYSREDKIYQNVHTVVREYKRQILEFGNVDDEDLRQIAKAHSRRDRIKARKMGTKDAEAVSNPKSGSKFGWFHKELAAFRARQHRVSALPSTKLTCSHRK